MLRILIFVHKPCLKFNLINAIVPLVMIVAYTIVARRYYTSREGEMNLTTANTQYEPNYDYDDYDNFNVHTVTKSNTSTL